MPAAVTGFFGKVKNTWAQFSMPQRTLVILAIAVLVLGATALYSWAAKPTMAPVFSNLSPADASAVVDQLEAEGVKYELADGGGTVLVPREQLYDLRISLAATGVGTTEDGYSLLDDMGMTSSDFQQQVTYQRALEGELAKTITAINGVSAATVHLALPEESVFVDRAVDPTASVFVDLEAGKQLEASAVQAVINLVSSAVPHMDATGVTVVDAAGAVLSATGLGTGPGGASDYEEDVTSDVQAMLDRVVGPGNAVVSVQAELSRDETDRLTETFTPADGAPPLSESTSTEEYTGTGQAVGGVLGPDNIAVPNGEGDGSYTREDSVLNNPVNKVTEQTTVNPGGVARQSVSVVVDAQAGAGLSLAELERMVTAAAGIDPARGDIVAVSRMAFDTTAADAAAEALAAAEEQAAAERQAELIRNAIIAVVLLVIVLLVAAFIRRARRERREEIDLGELKLLQAQQAEDAAELEAGTPADTTYLPSVPEPIQLPPATEADAMRAEIAALATEDPAVVAAQLREWLAVRR
ncbi:flagellar M-ring protein FliF [Georgenia yuyongxinii]|uniref:Flagellar M-ring protein n=1 Tax=Georgenia yuyongxinii TaxID=2589797 RepID=A0A5B8BZC8_9MICO|nr:flagellar basal-body MS-ring/collar protein FliF [Georgenia yuyongxinii]QDC23638.1 flagellar M-ring protein FliF [Georgenia yuyongxinii]